MMSFMLVEGRRTSWYDVRRKRGGQVHDGCVRGGACPARARRGRETCENHVFNPLLRLRCLPLGDMSNREGRKECCVTRVFWIRFWCEWQLKEVSEWWYVDREIRMNRGVCHECRSLNNDRSESRFENNVSYYVTRT